MTNMHVVYNMDNLHNKMDKLYLPNFIKLNKYSQRMKN